MKLDGFTLIELLITLILIIGLALSGMYSHSFLRHKNERQTIIDELGRAIQYAKLQAIILGHTVSLSSSDKELNWSKGMVLTDDNKNKILYQWQWRHPNWNILWSGVNTSARIRFSNNPVNAISNGKFIIFDPYTKEQIVVFLNRLGRIRVTSQ